jgi:hypothetical protein
VTSRLNGQKNVDALTHMDIHTDLMDRYGHTHRQTNRLNGQTKTDTNTLNGQTHTHTDKWTVRQVNGLSCYVFNVLTKVYIQSPW